MINVYVRISKCMLTLSMYISKYIFMIFICLSVFTVKERSPLYPCKKKHIFTKTYTFSSPRNSKVDTPIPTRCASRHCKKFQCIMPLQQGLPRLEASRFPRWNNLNSKRFQKVSMRKTEWVVLQQAFCRSWTHVTVGTWYVKSYHWMNS